MARTATAKRPTGTRKPSTTPQQRSDRVEALSAKLAELRDSTDPDLFETYEARFEGHYSPRNSALIVAQDPDATVVHGFRAWQALGRQVRTGCGEKGIFILAPAGSRTEDAKPTNTEPTAPEGAGNDGTDAKVRRFFRPVAVFDIRQTDPIAASVAA